MPRIPRRIVEITRPNIPGKKSIAALGNSVHIGVYGIKGTRKALREWTQEFNKEVKNEQAKISRLVANSVRKVIRTGRSKSMPMQNVSGVTNFIRVARGANQASRAEPFAGTGNLARGVRVTVGNAQSGGGFISKKRLNFNVRVDIIGQQRRLYATALIFGFKNKVTPRMQRFLSANGVNPPPAVGRVLITPPRDFIRAGVLDVQDELQKKVAEITAKANRKTNMKIPHLAVSAAGITMASEHFDPSNPAHGNKLFQILTSMGFMMTMGTQFFSIFASMSPSRLFAPFSKYMK